MKKIAVLYHVNCLDGFSAAWAAWKKFGSKADYIPVEPARLPDKKFKDQLMYFVDTSLAAPLIEKLQKNNNHIIIIDHHLTARENVRSADEYYFDLRHSGAVLSWQYFHPNKKIPKLLRYVEDYDLWKLKLPHTREIIVSIRFLGKNFKNWEKLVRNFEKPKTFKKYVEEGRVAINYENDVVKRLASRAQLVKFAGHKIFAVNSSFLKNEIGEFLRKKRPPFSIVWYQSKDEIRFSLRSAGKIDVSKIAKKFGGGGHKAAAGFSIPLNKKLPWKAIK